MRVLLTGATGFIGSRLLEILLETAGIDQVMCLSRGCGLPAQARVKWISGSVTSAAWHDEVGPVDVVVHAAANASFGGGADHDTVNHIGTVGVLEFARKAGARHFIFVSTIGAVDRAPTDRARAPLDRHSTPAPRSAYGRAKLRAEIAVEQSGLTWTIVRPAWVYGKGMRLNSHLCVLASIARNRRLIALFDWPGRVSVVHVDDLCLAVAKIVVSGGCRNEILFAASEAVSIGDIFRCFGKASGFAAAARLPVFRWPVRRLISRIHGCLPLTIANLFIDYLTCETKPFRDWIAPQEPQTFQSRFGDVMSVVDPLRKVWLVTGAGSGIGRSLCQILSARGTKVIGVDRDFPDPKPETAVCITLDLTTPDAVSQLRDVVYRADVAVVVNNAGLGFRGPFIAITPEQVQSTLAVNVEFPLRFTHAIIRILAKRRGTIVNVASSMAGVPLPGMCLYAASKGFIQSWSIGLAEELRDQVHVLTVAPTGTNTNFQHAAGVKGGQKRLMDPDHVAAAIVRGASSGKSYCFVGPWQVRVALFLGGLLPGPFQARLWGLLFGTLR
jgi:nucleoside-diphosphate-sugar epimerase